MWLVKLKSKPDPNIDSLQIVPDSWVVNDTECWFPKNKRPNHTLEQLVKDNLPILSSKHYEKCSMLKLSGNG